jgi:hypothetical protein
VLEGRHVLVLGCFIELFQLLVDLVARTAGIRPVIANGAGLFSDAHRAQKPRQRDRHSAERPTLFLLFGLDRFPAIDGATCVVDLFVSENPRMPTNQFLTNRVDHTVDVKPSFLLGEGSLEDDLKQQVAELFSEYLGRALVDRVDDLVRLLDHVLPEGFEGLLTIPGAAVGTKQRAHQLDEVR